MYDLRKHPKWDACVKMAEQIADYLTDHPEISGQEEGGCAYLVQFLRQQGWEVVTPYAEMPYAFRAYRPERAGTVPVALLCEYDALPEVGHACSHSLSCAISILAGLMLDGLLEESGMSVEFVGTPGEEFIGGKALMEPKGAFDRYACAAI